MTDDLKCYIGMHRYKIHKEESVTDARGNVIGKAIVSVCEHCGKIKVTYVSTVNE